MTGLSLKTPQPKSCYGRDNSAIVALDVGQQIKAQLAAAALSVMPEGEKIWRSQ